MFTMCKYLVQVLLKSSPCCWCQMTGNHQNNNLRVNLLSTKNASAKSPGNPCNQQFLRHYFGLNQGSGTTKTTSHATHRASLLAWLKFNIFDILITNEITFEQNKCFALLMKPSICAKGKATVHFPVYNPSCYLPSVNAVNRCFEQAGQDHTGVSFPLGLIPRGNNENRPIWRERTFNI